MHYVQAKGLVSKDNGINIYRGCSHGCIYCDSRSKCYNFTHEFEDIEIKENAPELLEKALISKRNKCMIGTGAMTDPYIHLEEKLGYTRKCLEIIDKYEFGVAIQTKSTRILRDLDILKSINQKSKAVVSMTLTTYDDELAKVLEPNVSTTSERFEALKVFRDAEIPTICWISPILPFINDTEENIKGLLDYAVEAKVKGIMAFGVGVTLREGDREYFYDALDKHFPGIKRKYIKTFGNAYNCPSPDESKLWNLIKTTCREHNIIYDPNECFKYMREYPEKYSQLKLTDFLGE